jgi:hypothetical protein
MLRQETHTHRQPHTMRIRLLVVVLGGKPARQGRPPIWTKNGQDEIMMSATMCETIHSWLHLASAIWRCHARERERAAAELECWQMEIEMEIQLGMASSGPLGIELSLLPVRPNLHQRVALAPVRRLSFGSPGERGRDCRPPATRMPLGSRLPDRNARASVFREFMKSVSVQFARLRETCEGNELLKWLRPALIKWNQTFSLI